MLLDGEEKSINFSSVALSEAFLSRFSCLLCLFFEAMGFCGVEINYDYVLNKFNEF